MSIAAAWPQVLDFFGTPLFIEPSAGQLSGDAGLLPVRQFDQRIGLTRAFADALDDPRDADLTNAVLQRETEGLLAEAVSAPPPDGRSPPLRLTRWTARCGAFPRWG
jgi:hypothetical protein